jgi:hypothetical protein
LDRSSETAVTKKKAGKKEPSATTRSTSGAGFAFEDLVAADFLSHFICDIPIHGIGIPGSRLLMQTGAMGWLIDDLLCIGEGADGTRRHLAISCKSNLQVTANGLPADFVAPAWAMWRQQDPFSRASDRIALVTRGRHVAFDSAWQDIKGWCASGDPQLAHARISASSKHTKIFNSIRRPGTVGDVEPSVEETIALIDRLEIFPTEFQLTNSQSLESALVRCRAALASEDLQEARNLWTALVQRAEAARLGNGTIELSDLLRELSDHFALKTHPSISAAWSRLLSLSIDHSNVIETELPGGHQLARLSERAAIVGALESEMGCSVMGDSGVGKSAAVRLALDNDLPGATQVWLGPDELKMVLSEKSRSSVGLNHPLSFVLNRAPGNRKILVLDSIERLDRPTVARLRELLASLEASFKQGDRTWRVVVIGQMAGMDDLFHGRSATLWPKIVVGLLEGAAVRGALFSMEPFRWIASDADVPHALTNLRTLAWVMRSSSSFAGELGGQGLASVARIADRLWQRWTNGKAPLQRLMMRLAERDAAFERSFAISELEGNDAVAFEQRLPETPLSVRRNNRIEFQHDLASDWARYQRLKEVGADVSHWSKLAGHPLWMAALRLFGQYLLEEQDQDHHGWNWAFSAVLAAGQTDAVDLLLDALCLDPQLDVHLEARMELFFSDGAQLFLRLLRRFVQIGTTPIGLLPATADSGIRLHFEAKMREPIFGRWAPLARFFSRHVQRIADLASPLVSEVCDLWLSKTPPTLGQGKMPFRDVFARIALETARTEQILSSVHRTYYGRDGAGSVVFRTALSGAHDLPDEVAVFALEMAWRRPLSQETAARIGTMQADEQAKREAAAAKHAARHQSHEPPIHISSRVDLPPWPLGPSGRLNSMFRKAVLHENALASLMQINPVVASEVLLACIIEDQPFTDYGYRYRDDNLGLEFDQESYPTIFWKSPFFVFLGNKPKEALAALRNLLDFAIDRWASRAPEGAMIPSLTVVLEDGQEREVPGDYHHFGWSQQDSSSTGQLFCALDALERWLINLLDEDVDVAPWCRQILDMHRSTALLGVLVNVGKYRPALFKGVLAPLTEIEALYEWDYYRVQTIHFDSFNWIRHGEIVFQAAQNWALAPHRKLAMTSVIVRLVLSDVAFAQRVSVAAEAWPEASSQKERLDQRILRAQLDRRNYESAIHEASQKAVWQLVFPAELQKEIDAYQQQTAPDLERVMLPEKCKQLMDSDSDLDEADATYLATLLPEPGSILPEDDELRRAVAAAAATLLAKGATWIRSHPKAQAQAHYVVRALVDAVGDGFANLRGQQRSLLVSYEALQFAAIGTVHAALDDPMPESWDRVLLILLTSEDNQAIRALMREAAHERHRLGAAWYRLMFLAVLAVGLRALPPRWLDDTTCPRWDRWLRRLRTLQVFGVEANLEDFDPLGVAHRIERVLMVRYRRSKLEMDVIRRETAQKVRFPDLDTDGLASAFDWLLDKEQARTLFQVPENGKLLRRLWDLEAWRLAAQRDGTDDEFGPPSGLGYAVLQVAPEAVLATDDGGELARSILILGTDGHYAVEHFLASWFLTLYKDPNPERFVAKWSEMLTIAFEKWTSAGRRYRVSSMLGQLLGLNAQSQLSHAAEVQAQIPALIDYYRLWAEKHMGRDEDGLAAFARFLTSKAGRSLRQAGLPWLESSLNKMKTFRDHTTGDSLAEAMDVVLSEHHAMLMADPAARGAMISIVGRLVRDGVVAAMGLPARIASLR